MLHLCMSNNDYSQRRKADREDTSQSVDKPSDDSVMTDQEPMPPKAAYERARVYLHAPLGN